jgi:hypothetical protein
MSGRGRWWTVAVLVVGAVALVGLLVQLTWALDAPPKTDYLPFATGARMLHSDPGCMYCSDAQAATQAAILGYVPTAGFPKPFVNPPLVAWVLQPLAGLPLRTGLLVLLLVALGALAVAARLADRLLPQTMPGAARLVLLIGGLLSLPAVTAVGLAQWAPLLVLAALGALAALRRDRQVLAGVLLSVLLIKPQTVWLVLPALVVARSWRVLLGVAAGAAGWLLTGLALVGPGQMLELPRLIVQRHVDEAFRTAGVPGMVTDLTGSGTAAFLAAAVLAGGAVAVALALRSRLRAEPGLAIGLGIAASLAFAPHVFPDDLMLLTVTAVVWARFAPGAAMAGVLGLSVAYALDAWLPGAMAPATVFAVLGVAVGATVSVWLRRGVALSDVRGADAASSRSGVLGQGIGAG